MAPFYVAGNTLMVCELNSHIHHHLSLSMCVSVGSGGNNHAVEYYESTKHPLAVKLGTITPDGGDVYSYDEDDMVVDPLLTQHLAHFGIDIASMTKVSSSVFVWHIHTTTNAFL